jgi:hypothetical protein
MIHRNKATKNDVVVVSKNTKGSSSSSSSVNNNNGTPSKGKRRVYFEPQPMTAVEFLIYVSTILFVGVFGIMQLVFLYKLHVYEASVYEGSHPQHQQEQEDWLTPHSSSRAMQQQQQVIQEETPPPLQQQQQQQQHSAIVLPQVSNRQRIEFMANKTKRNNNNNNNNPWPPLEDLVDMQQGSILGNVQFLLDFAILGFEKSGTYTLKQILQGHKQTDGLLEENINLYMNRPHQFVADLYHQLHPKEPDKYYRFYHNNNDIYQPCSLKSLHEYFPDTKLIIAIRHPVRYVSTLYLYSIESETFTLL